MTDEANKLAGMIDISCVQAVHSRPEIDQMIDAAIKYHFAAVFTLPAFSGYVAEKLLDQPDIAAGGVVSFPGGGDTTAQKRRQAGELIASGCGEIDMVMNLTALKSHEDTYVVEDILAVREEIHHIPLKVIIESPLLSEQEIRKAVELCVKGGADYVKTSTGWYEKSSDVRQVEIMMEQAAGRIKIKAAGGIRTLEMVRKMHAIGCSRFGLGLNSATKLMEAMR